MLAEKIEYTSTQTIANSAYMVKVATGCELELATHALSAAIDVLNANLHGELTLEQWMFTLDAAVEMVPDFQSGARGCEACKAMDLPEFTHKVGS